MTSQATDPEYSETGWSATRFLRRNLPLVIFLILAGVTMLSVFFFFNPGSEPSNLIAFESEIDTSLIDPDAPVAPIVKPVNPQPVVQRLVQSPPPQKIGLIAGHRGSDSGTECQDGLTEVQVTSDLAERVADRLRKLDIETETLDEFDVRLNQYSATALISIHIDSCDYINEIATGFKIAGSPNTDSSGLTICMQQAYGDATQLPYHPNSITPHMSEYHVFNKISTVTPALIIEVGFLNLDREILTTQSDVVVNGLVDGIVCFLGQ
jgi:N-acetylmuramoyl-L-alanine amidase